MTQHAQDRIETTAAIVRVIRSFSGSPPASAVYREIRARLPNIPPATIRDCLGDLLDRDLAT